MWWMAFVIACIIATAAVWVFFSAADDSENDY